MTQTLRTCEDSRLLEPDMAGKPAVPPVAHDREQPRASIVAAEDEKNRGGAHMRVLRPDD
jgi:hypothetical protein